MTAPGSEEITIDLPGLRLAARAWGPREGRPILGLHGWLDNAATFDRLAPLLPGVRLVALDLPGHGRSQHRPASVAYHFLDYVVDAAAVIETLGWKRCSVMAHSLGAGIAMFLAASTGDRIERLVLLDGLAPGTTEPAEAPARLATAIKERLAGPEKRSRVYPTLEAAMERLQKVNPTLSEPSVRALVTRATVAVEGGFAFASDPRLRGTSPVRMTRAHVEAFVSQVTCPALLVRPDQGIPVDAGMLAEYTSKLRGLRIAPVPGGHHVHMENAELVGALVREFLG